jgi:hypothetical protein
VTESSKPNPYHVLRLAPGASSEEIVARAEELFALAQSETDRSLCKWARQELLRDPSARRRYGLLEVPGAAYRDEEWARFGRMFRRNPADIGTLADQAGPPSTTDFDLVAILGQLLDCLLAPPDADVEAALRHPPVPPGYGTSPLGVDDVLFG